MIMRIKKSQWYCLKKIGIGLFILVSIVSIGINVCQYFLFKVFCVEETKKITSLNGENEAIVTLRDCGAVGPTHLFVDLESSKWDDSKRLVSFSHAQSLDDVNISWEDNVNIKVSYSENVDYICKYDEEHWRDLNIDISKE
jgi:hypothetical protein